MANVIDILIEGQQVNLRVISDARVQIQQLTQEMARVTPAANQATAAVDRVGAASRRAATGGLTGQLAEGRLEIGRLTAALSTIAPQATAAIAPLQGIAAAGVALGPVAAVIGAVTVAVGGLVAAAHGLEGLASDAERLSNLSQSTGASAVQLRVLGQAFKDAQVPEELLRLGLKELARNIRDGNPALTSMGVTSKDVGEAFLQLSDTFQAAPDGIAKTTAAMGLLGSRSGAQLIPVMNQGRESFIALEGRMLSTGQLAAALANGELVTLDNKFDDLHNSIEGLKEQLLLLAEPGISGAVSQLTDLVSIANDARKAFTALLQRFPMDFRVAVPGLPELALAVELIERARGKRKLIGEKQDFVTFDQAAGELGLPAPKHDDQLSEILKSSTDHVATLNALLNQTPQFLASIGTSAEQVNRVLGLELSAAAAKAREAAQKLADAVAQVNRELAFTQLGTEGLDHLAQEFARGEISTAGLVTQLQNTARVVDVIQRSDPFAKLESTARALGAALDLPIAKSRELIDTLSKADELQPRGAVPAAPPLPAIAEQVPVPPVQTFGQFLKKDELDEWRKAMDEITQSTTAQVALIRGAFEGLGSGIDRVFSKMTANLRNSSNAIVSIVGSMIDQIIAEFARLAIAGIIKFFVGLLAGGPAGAAAGAAAGVAGGGDSATIGSARRATPSSAGRIGGVASLASQAFTGTPAVAAQSRAPFSAPQASARSVAAQPSPLASIASRTLTPPSAQLLAAPTRIVQSVLPTLAASIPSVNRQNDRAMIDLTAALRSLPSRSGGSVSGSPNPVPGFAPIANGREWAAQRQQPAGQLIHIHALDARSVLTDILSPMGALRRAGDRLVVEE